MNALQVFPNLIGLIGLSGLVAQIARERCRRPASTITVPVSWGLTPRHGPHALQRFAS